MTHSPREMLAWLTDYLRDTPTDRLLPFPDQPPLVSGRGSDEALRRQGARAVLKMCLAKLQCSQNGGELVIEEDEKVMENGRRWKPPDTVWRLGPETAALMGADAMGILAGYRERVDG